MRFLSAQAQGEGSMVRLNRRQVALAALAAAGCAPQNSAPDLIIHGGPIYTGLAANPRVEAVRVRN